MADPTNDRLTVIGPDAHIKGDMSFETNARLLGSFDGKIKGKGQLHIAEGAKCKAQVEAAQIVVDGSVEGNLQAKERIQLNAKSQINGDIVAAKLIVAEGAAFSGHVTVGADAAKRGARPDGAPQPAAAARQAEPAKA